VTSAIRGETVTLIRKGAPTGQDALGNDTFTPTEVPWPSAVWAPGGSTENVQGGDTVVELPSLTWVNNIPDLTAVDQIRRANGDLFEIDGEPADYPSPFSTTRVLQVHLLKVTG
jgi:hypothetical protein